MLPINSPFINAMNLDEVKKVSKHTLAKKIHHGWHKGKGAFAKIADKAGAKYGSAEAGKKVAAAIMWKKYTHEGVELDEVSPPGWEGTVKAMKKHKDITNPWALSWWMKGRGNHSHYTKNGKKKK
jgi:hypothetical protein